MIDDDAALTTVLDSCGVTEDEYIQALQTMRRKISIICKRKPNETMISPYNTVLLNLIKSNVNVQFVTGIYRLLVYVKEKGNLVKVLKESSSLNVREKLRKVELCPYQ